MAFLPQNNLAYPVQISSARSVGSGFYCTGGENTYLATAKHVLFEKGLQLWAREVVVTSVATNLVDKNVLKLDCEALLGSGNLRKHDRSDVAVVKMGARKEEEDAIALSPGIVAEQISEIVGLGEATIRMIAEVGISNEVILFGYPASLGREAQIDRSRPLLRRGIVAGKTEDSRIVLDCPVYFGNSGGLVLEVERQAFGFKFRGIGLAVEMIPFVEELWSRQFKAQTGIRYENSGYSLVEPMDRVRELF